MNLFFPVAITPPFIPGSLLSRSLLIDPSKCLSSHQAISSHSTHRTTGNYCTQMQSKWQSAFSFTQLHIVKWIFKWSISLVVKYFQFWMPSKIRIKSLDFRQKNVSALKCCVSIFWLKCNHYVLFLGAKNVKQSLLRFSGVWFSNPQCSGDLKTECFQFLDCWMYAIP